MRLYTEVIAVSLVSAIVAWARQAPPDPDQRASYLCKPVAGAAALLQRFESAMREDGRVAAPWQPWRVEPVQGCERFVRRLLPDSSDGEAPPVAAPCPPPAAPVPIPTDAAASTPPHE